MSEKPTVLVYCANGLQAFLGREKPLREEAKA